MNKINPAPTAFLWVVRDDDEIGHYGLHRDLPTYDSSLDECNNVSVLEEKDFTQINEHIIQVHNEPEPRPCPDLCDDRRLNPTCRKCDYLNSYWYSKNGDLLFTPDQWAKFGTGIDLEPGGGPVRLRLVAEPVQDLGRTTTEAGQ